MTREQILTALQAALVGLCAGRVYRSRKEQLPEVPAIVIRPETEEISGDWLGVTDAVLTVSLEVYARGETPDQAAESTLNSLLAILNAADPLGLGSDAQIRPALRIDWNFENYDDAQVIVRIDIDYRN